MVVEIVALVSAGVSVGVRVGVRLGVESKGWNGGECRAGQRSAGMVWLVLRPTM